MRQREKVASPCFQPISSDMRTLNALFSIADLIAGAAVPSGVAEQGVMFKRVPHEGAAFCINALIQAAFYEKDLAFTHYSGTPCAEVPPLALKRSGGRPREPAG